ncbi:hypothetical protein [Micromonospora sp. KC213]|uniref:hypothetical protein n=1 Tax=Micromonospora sp. KC213 TaxID=2530378 RepID=UPI001A9FA353|nr:hypothetical protein [Micromonospora sp. KC213]
MDAPPRLVEPAASAAAATPTGSRQDADEVARTLASLGRVDDLPLYEMTYAGGYDPTVGTDARPARVRSAVRSSRPVGTRLGRCSPATSTGRPTRRFRRAAASAATGCR